MTAMQDETYDQTDRRLRRELMALGTRNVVVHLKDGTSFKARLPNDAGKCVGYGAFYYLLRNKEGNLVLSTKIALRKIDRFVRDTTEYGVFNVGGGHAE